MNKASELRRESQKELRSQLTTLRRKQLELRILHRTGQFSDIAKFKDVRRDIARVKTVLNEHKLSG